MTNAMDWKGVAGRSWADEWRRTDRSFGPLTAALMARIAQQPGRRVLDIGCGAGELALGMAAARPDAEVRGLDISPELLAAASGRANLPNLRFDFADAAQWRDPAFVPDLMVSRHGVMFFDDPAAAFDHLAAVSTPDARLVFSCFRSNTLNSWAGEVGRIVAEEMGTGASANPHAPGPFAFADPVRVESILSGSWQDIAFEPVDFAYLAGEGDDPVADAIAFTSRIGPFAAAMREATPAVQARLGKRIEALMAAHRHGNQVVFSAAAWIVSARRKAPADQGRGGL